MSAIGIVVAIALFFAMPHTDADGVQFVGHFHPLVVHLPIGVLVLVVLAELFTLSSRFGERRLRALDALLGGVLGFLLFAMLGAFTIGTLLGSGGGYAPGLLGPHRALGLAGVIGAALTLIAWSRRPAGSRTVYRALLFSTAAVVTVGAHFGGSLTHGDGYLTRYAPAWLHRRPAPVAVVQPPPDPSKEKLVFGDVVLPILTERCGQCHGERKQSSGLRLDSFQAIQKGSDEGPVVVAGSAAKSVLVQRMLLPTTDDDHMPPAPKPGATAEEIALLKWWIDRGASEKLTVSDSLPPADARAVLEKAEPARGNR